MRGAKGAPPKFFIMSYLMTFWHQDMSSTSAHLDFSTRRGNDPSSTLLLLDFGAGRRVDTSILVYFGFDTWSRDGPPYQETPPPPSFSSISPPGGGMTPPPFSYTSISIRRAGTGLLHLDFSTRRGNDPSFTSISMHGGGAGLLHLHSRRFHQEGERPLLHLRSPRFQHQEGNDPSSSSISPPGGGLNPPPFSFTSILIRRARVGLLTRRPLLHPRSPRFRCVEGGDRPPPPPLTSISAPRGEQPLLHPLLARFWCHCRLSFCTLCTVLGQKINVHSLYLIHT